MLSKDKPHLTEIPTVCRTQGSWKQVPSITFEGEKLAKKKMGDRSELQIKCKYKNKCFAKQQ